MRIIKKQRRDTRLEIPPQIIAMWNPGGNNTANITARLGRELSQHTTVFIAELPCLGIPRLFFQYQNIDREINIDNLIVEYERQGEINLRSIEINDDLFVLPANPNIMPDYPSSDKVEKIDTLLDFPIILTNKVRQKGISIILFECQGQLTNPMTFQAIKQADKVITTINNPADLGWTKVNLKRLSETYYFDYRKFKVIVPNIDIISDYEKALSMKLYVNGKEIIFKPEIIFQDNLMELFVKKEVHYFNEDKPGKFSFLRKFKTNKKEGVK